MIGWEQMIAFSAAILELGSSKGVEFLQSKTQQCNAPCYTPWPPRLDPGLDSGLPSLHCEIRRDAGAFPGSTAPASWWQVLLAEILCTLSATPASSVLMQSLQEPTGKSKRAGCCSAHRQGREKKTFSGGKNSICRELIRNPEGRKQVNIFLVSSFWVTQWARPRALCRRFTHSQHSLLQGKNNCRNYFHSTENRTTLFSGLCPDAQE